MKTMARWNEMLIKIMNKFFSWIVEKQEAGMEDFRNAEATTNGLFIKLA